MQGMPHPNSRASLLALQDNLRREALSRARALRDLPLKKEFEAENKHGHDTQERIERKP